MEAVGEDFNAGFANGITGTQTGVAAAATAMANGSVDAVNSALETSSPSRLLHQIGRWFGEGFWRGIREEERWCRQAAHDTGITVIEVLTATATVDAQNVGQLFGINLAKGITQSLGSVKAAALGLATAATAEATAVLGHMGLLGVAGSGASMQPQSAPISLGSSQAQQGGSKHCVHEHHVHLDGKELRILADHQIEKFIDKHTAMSQGQKR
jgi:hypothetical protein